MIAAAVTGGIVACLTLVLGVLLFSSASRTRESFLAAKARRQDIATAKESLAKAAKMPDAAKTSGVQAASKFQETLQQAAGTAGCEVADYSAVDTIAPFITHYEKDTKDKGWGQIDVRTTLHGQATQIASTLAALVHSPVPIEIDGVTASRTGMGSDGKPVVDAKVEMRVLTFGGQS